MPDLSFLACALTALSKFDARRALCEEKGSRSSVDDLKQMAAELQSESERLSRRASELSQRASGLADRQSESRITGHRLAISQAADQLSETISETIDQALRAADTAKRAAEAARVAAESARSAARSQWEEVGASARAVVENAKQRAARAKERQREAQVNIDMVQRVWRRIGDCGKLAATFEGSDEPKRPQEVMADFVDMCRSRAPLRPDWDPRKFGRKLVDIDCTAALSYLSYAKAAYDCDAAAARMTRDEYERLPAAEKSENCIFTMCADISEVLYTSPEGGFEGADPLKPRFFVALRYDGTVVLAIRGTATLADAITDMLCDDVEIHTGEDDGDNADALRVHRGINAGAAWVAKSAMPYIREGLSRGGSSGRLLVTGHSLGGGVALIAGLLMAPELSPRVWVEAIAFGPPPVLSDTLQSRGWRRIVLSPWNLSLRSFVNDGDVISRTCMHSLEYLVGGWGESSSHQLADYKWSVPLVIPGKVYVIGTDPSQPLKAVLTNGMDPALGKTSLVDFFCEIARADRPMVPKSGYAHLIDSYETALMGKGDEAEQDP
ncbi:hypothetical protein FOZ61_010254 [Perkinsus olseni]|uniref:sn-1-specific diacylglycerol lipase n=1 Tax=Perkinsus olseni TaxID=32597 RepID=A0A7J6KXV4_PEROL|nr:hypothetical protein FOZ61_010254 [Perkinsus olseni]